jgi:hydroxymethylpyrimidine/phosphomethylpyrimidine kinase
MSRRKSCLTIAGLDPSGGAGVLVDVAVFRALGFHPACVVAALTVQDTSRVEKVVGVDPGLVKSQAEAVFKT